MLTQSDVITKVLDLDSELVYKGSNFKAIHFNTLIAQTGSPLTLSDEEVYVFMSYDWYELAYVNLSRRIAIARRESNFSPSTSRQMNKLMSMLDSYNYSVMTVPADVNKGNLYDNSPNWEVIEHILRS